MPGGNVFHRRAKRVKLDGARVISGESTNREKTLDKVRGDQDIVEVKRSRKHQVTY
jgi:hypothetical protein